MRNLVIGAIVVIIVLVGGYFLLKGGSKQQTTPTVTNQPATASPQTTTGEEQTTETETPSLATITFSSSGFSPSSVTIKSGGTITWVNDSNGTVEIGSAPHPTHTDNQEVSVGEYVLTLKAGEQKTVTLNRTGTFGYHKHNNFSGQGGTITVE